MLLSSFSWQELRQHPWRTATALIAIMLGVALGFAVHVINQSALDEFSRAVRSVNGQPDLQLHAMQGGLPLALYAQVAQARGVASAVPWVETTVLLPGSTADLQTRSTQGAAQGAELEGGRVGALGDFRLRLTPEPVLQAEKLPEELLPELRNILIRHGFWPCGLEAGGNISGFYDAGNSAGRH